MLSDANLKYAFAGLAMLGLGGVAYSQYRNAAEAKPERALITMGMAPQLPLIREIADEAGWKVSCEGVSGEMTTLRLSPGFWGDDEAGAILIEDLHAVSTIAYEVTGSQAADENCDAIPPVTGSVEGAENVAIAFGLPVQLAQFREIAASCDLQDPEIAPISEFYREKMEPGAIREGWQALYIDIAQSSRYGPTMCYMIMSDRYEATLAEGG